MLRFPKAILIAGVYPANAKINELREKPIMPANLRTKLQGKNVAPSL